MGAKLTQEQADELDKGVGAIPIGEYKGSDIKREYRCTICDKPYFSKPNSVRTQNVITCIKCSYTKRTNQKIHTQEQADILDKIAGAIPIGKYINSKTKREYECPKCHQHFYRTPNAVVNCNQIVCNQCGKCSGGIKKRLKIDKVKESILSLGFEPLFDEYINNQTKIKIRCHCGKIFKTILSSVTSKHITSCGHCSDPEIGTKYGKLTPIIIFPATTGGCMVVCECDCGRDTHVLTGSTIVNGSTKSCGNCGLRINGNFTSYTALQLHDLIEQITGQKWEHNYHIKGGGCVDIANPILKIAIEYDGYYNHMVRTGDRSEKNRKKINKLIKSGWRVLHIKSDGRDMPTEKQLCKVLLNDFQHNTYKRTITMKSWKNMENKNAC